MRERTSGLDFHRRPGLREASASVLALLLLASLAAAGLAEVTLRVEGMT